MLNTQKRQISWWSRINCFVLTKYYWYNTKREDNCLIMVGSTVFSADFRSTSKHFGNVIWPDDLYLISPGLRHAESSLDQFFARSVTNADNLSISQQLSSLLILKLSQVWQMFYTTPRLIFTFHVTERYFLSGSQNLAESNYKHIYEVLLLDFFKLRHCNSRVIHESSPIQKVSTIVCSTTCMTLFITETSDRQGNVLC